MLMGPPSDAELARLGASGDTLMEREPRRMEFMAVQSSPGPA